jgi:hypothetical protein
MTVDETLELARSYSVEVRLNAAGDGLELEVETDPPQALINVLSHAKGEIVAALRQREIARRGLLITRWINDHFRSTPAGVCRHCGEGVREADVFVRLYCGDDSGDVHTSCQPTWRKTEEARARAALGLGPLPELSDRHQSFLAAVEFSPPPDVSAEHWRTAMRGLEAFLLAGHGDEAERLGWPRDELYCVPQLWSQIHLCGTALLIGDCEVIGVTPDAIRIKTASGATQSFYRRPAIDQARVDKWIRDHLTADWPHGCWHCRRAFIAGQKFVDVRGDGVIVRFHAECESEWRRAQEIAAREALGLDRSERP